MVKTGIALFVVTFLFTFFVMAHGALGQTTTTAPTTSPTVMPSGAPATGHGQ